MKVDLGFANFGQRGGAHSLLEVSDIDDELAAKLRWHTDRPPNPSGGDLTEFVAGYAVDDSYVVQRTRPDPDAGRPGMVSSSVLVADFETIATIEFPRLVEALGVKVPQAACEDAATTLEALAEHGKCYLTEGSNYLDIVCEVWRVLSPDDRERLVFGRLFTATDHYPIGSRSLQVFGVDNAHVGRFPEQLVVDRVPPDSWTGATSVAAFDEQLPLRSTLEIVNPSIAQLHQMGTAHLLLAELQALSEEDLRSLAALIGLLAPSAQTAASTKEAIGSRLQSVARTATFEHMRGLRTLPYGSFPNLDLDNMTRSWVDHRADVVSDRHAATELMTAVHLLDSDTSTDPWSASLGSALADAARKNSGFAERLIGLAMNEPLPGPFEWIGSAVEADFDELVASTDGRHPDWLFRSAIKIGWPQTHAVTCRTDAPVEAWEDHLSLTHSRATRARLAERMTASALVDAATQIRLESLIEIAGEAVANDPTSILPARPSEEGWLLVWDASITAGADPWAAVEPDQVASVILNRTLSGEPTPEAVIVALSLSAGADIASHPRRSDLWNRLPSIARDRFLGRTALSLSLSEGTADGVEPILAAAMTSGDNIRTVSQIDVTAALTLLSTANAVREQHVRAIAIVELSPAQSEQLGSIVVNKGNSSAVRFVINKSRGRADLRPAAKRCEASLSFLDRLRLIGHADRPSAAEVAQGLAQIAGALYSNGPADRDLWQRAGGDPAELPDGSRGSERWRRALEMMAKGAAGAPTFEGLLGQMRADFPKNDDLKTIGNAL